MLTQEYLDTIVPPDKQDGHQWPRFVQLLHEEGHVADAALIQHAWAWFRRGWKVAAYLHG